MTATTRTAREHGIVVRAATAADVPRLQRIILNAAHQLLSGTHLTPAQVTAAERAGMFDLETALVAAGNYYVIAVDGTVVAGSGWSAGGRMIPTGASADVDGGTAVMRASYIDPAWARRGLATLLAHTTEVAARLAGFTTFGALCTPPSAALRRRLGYSLVAYEDVEPSPGVVVRGAHMRKVIA